MHLSAVNSINWARIAAQIPYYVAAALALGAAAAEGRGLQRPHRQFRQRPGRLGGAADGAADRPADRRVQPQRHPGPVPGDQRHVDARRGAVAVAQHGHPGQLQLRAPAVRAADRDTAATASTYGRLPRHRPHAGKVPDAAWRRATTAVLHAIAGRYRHPWRKSAASMRPPATWPTRTPPSASPPPAPSSGRHGPTVAMATAHPAKFPGTCDRSRAPASRPLSTGLADLYDRVERYTGLPNDLAAVEAGVRAPPC